MHDVPEIGRALALRQAPLIRKRLDVDGLAGVPRLPDGVGEAHVANAVGEVGEADRGAVADGVDEVGLDLPAVCGAGVRVDFMEIVAVLAPLAGVAEAPVEASL